jgi:hypothetical protein
MNYQLTSLIPPFKTIDARLETAIEDFLVKEWKLFKAKAGERLLTGRLGRYVEDAFPEWDVDWEYNRFGARSKRSVIHSRGKSLDKRGHLVTPDIIVHKRLIPTGRNLLAIEAKHEGKKQGTIEDREKLASYLRPPLSYRYVALVTFSKTQHPWCEFELFSRRENPEQPKNSVEIALLDSNAKKSPDSR